VLVDASIVVPTYNPQERIFSRVLHALRSLDTAGLNVEFVIVDNRSTVPVAGMPCVREFLQGCPQARVVREERQGLTFARLAGIRSTSGQAIIVFDDDNVPAPGYVQIAVKAMRDLRDVAVWGPGTIEVEMLDPVPPYLQARVREAHNERKDRHVQYGCVPAGWQSFYPIGMGQVIRRDVAERYRASVESGGLEATDRQGGSLASGGDIQIVWQAINMGLAAGTSPALAVVHLIPGARTQESYLKRLAFGCGVSYYPALVQSFPGALERVRVPPERRRDARDLVHFLARRIARGRVRFLLIDFANLLGLVCGRRTVEGSGRNDWPFRLAKRMGLT
jgi:hypothetical protein